MIHVSPFERFDSDLSSSFLTLIAAKKIPHSCGAEVEDEGPGRGAGRPYHTREQGNGTHPCCAFSDVPLISAAAPQLPLKPGCNDPDPL